MVFTFAQIPVNDWLIGQCAKASWRSRVYALKYTLSFRTAPVAYWFIAQSHIQTKSFDVLFILQGALMVVAFTTVCFLPLKSDINNGVSDSHAESNFS